VTRRLVPVLMSGGAGTRLWPASRSDRPKQFLPLVDGRTLVRATLDRLSGLDATPPLVVANMAHAGLVAAELDDAGFDADRMILEPLGRNTAPAAAVAALELTKDGDDPIMLLLPADHVIEDAGSFRAAVRHGAMLAGQGRLVTFGIVPTHPETGYGYIRAGGRIDDVASKVAEFVEKPDADTARDYVASGDYMWNSGMFVFGCSDYLRALEEYEPEMLTGCRNALAAARVDGGLYLDKDEFSATPANSIDYAVMEHTDDAAVVPLDAGWSDVGSWTALWENSVHDEHGNTLVGDVAVVATTNSYVRADTRLVTVAGLDGVVVVETADAVLVTRVDSSQTVKEIVDILKREGRDEVVRTTED
jgi:mannose-1-phosphate guanylyltransferase/mannose-6-phosphate isomerase